MKTFGDFQFDEASRELRRGDSTVAIQGQSLDLLALLLSRAGELLTREEIRLALWPDRHVDFEHSLDVQINRLRTVLGDSGRTPRYIQTVPRKGYRFVAAVESRTRGWSLFSGAGTIRRLAQFASVAVLAGLAALLIARSRYEQFVPPRGASRVTSVR